MAAYLLGYDESIEETAATIQKIEFADDDKSAENAGPVDLRFDVAPSEAIDYFQRKRIVSPATFKKLEREAKAAAFMVSGIYREDLLQAFKFEITNALETGQTQKYVTKQFKDILAGAGHKELGDFHLESIIRSNTMSAYGVGRRKAMEESADLLPFWEYSAVNDDRTRPTHRALDGIVYPANHPFWDTHFPPWGFNCFLPGTKIEGRFQLGFRSWYDGKAVEITTRSGNRMRVTGNHPILTVNGFIAANALKQGDNVLSYVGGRERRLQSNGRRKSSVGISRTMQADVLSPNENENNSPMIVEQVFGSLLEFGDVARFPVTPNDFHRDARFGNGYVEVVNANGKLRNHVQSDELQSTQNSVLKFMDTAFSAKNSFGAFRSGGESVGTSASGIPRGAALTQNTNGSFFDTSPLNLFLVGTASQINASRKQITSDFGTREAEFAAELQNRYSALVTADEIVEVRNFDFCGHVYDFQTEGGWIVADGIFASNCRCTVIARLDMPDGYDHKRPNSDTTIAFDKEGLPAKAEYLTQVYDLKATKFVGVPKTADLEKALVDAATTAKDSRLLNHQNIPQIIVDKAREIRLEKVENLIGWNKDGNSVGHFKGNLDEVFYPQAVEALLDGGFDIHNHPPEKGMFFEAPSDFDFLDMVELNLRLRYIVTRNYLYQIRMPKNGWTENVIEDFYKSYEKHRTEIASKMSEKFINQLLNDEQIQDIERHLIWVQVAKDLKLKYKRFKVTEL